MIGDKPDGFILSELQGLRSALGDIGKLRGQGESFGARRQEHAVAAFLKGCERRELAFIGLAKRKIADTVGPMVTYGFRSIGERRTRHDLFGHDRNGVETTRSGDAQSRLLLVRANEQQTLQRGTGL